MLETQKVIRGITFAIIIMFVFIAELSASTEKTIVLSEKVPMAITGFNIFKWEFKGPETYYWEGLPVPNLFLQAEQNNGVEYKRRNDWRTHKGYLAAPNTGTYYIIWHFRFDDPGQVAVTAPFSYYADAKRASMASLSVSKDGKTYKVVDKIGKPHSERTGWYNGQLKYTVPVKAGDEVYLKFEFNDLGIWTPNKLKMEGLKVTLVPCVPNTDRYGLSRVDLYKFYHIDVASKNDMDTDGDGLSDWEEVSIANSSPTASDTDGDRLNDYEEFIFGSDPNSIDTDGDGLTDLDEWTLGSNPNNIDTTGDGLTDKEKFGISNPILLDSDRDGVPDAKSKQIIEIRRKLSENKTYTPKPGQLIGVHAEWLRDVDNDDLSLHDFAEYLRSFKMNYVLIGLWTYRDGDNYNLNLLNRHLTTLEKEGIKVSFLVMRANQPWEKLIPELKKHPNFIGLMLDEPVNIVGFFPWADKVNKLAGRKIAQAVFSPTLCEQLSKGNDWRTEVRLAKQSGKFSEIWADPYCPTFLRKVLFDPDIDGVIVFTHIGPREETHYRFSPPNAIYLDELTTKLCLMSGKHFSYYNIGRFVPMPNRGNGGWQPAIDAIMSVLNPGGKIPEKFQQKSFQIPWNWRTYPTFERKVIR